MFGQNSRIEFLALSLVLIPAVVHAGEPGIRGATFLKIGEGPRAIGMGEAQTAVADDSYASFWNPAGLANLTCREVALTYQHSIQDIQEQQANVAIPLGKKSAFGAYITRWSVGSFDSFDATGNSTGQINAADS